MNMIQAVVVNGKIEIKAPSELRDGETVSVLVLENSNSIGPMTEQEIAHSLQVLDAFTSTFPVEEPIEDLSAVARHAGEQEKQMFSVNAERVKRLFD